MVGPPKTLYDLRKVEAAVRVTCRVCGAQRLWDLEEMIQERAAARQSCDWLTVRHEAPCPAACDSRDAHVQAVPFGAGSAELRRRRATTTLVNLGIGILQVAAYPGASPTPMPREAVRLALRVLHPHVGQAALLTQFWEVFTKEPRLAHESPAKALVWIVQQLARKGYSIAPEFRWLL